MEVLEMADLIEQLHVKEGKAFVHSLAYLLKTAGGDSGGARRAAQFMLSLWDGSKYRADLQECLYCEMEMHKAMLWVWHGLYATSSQLDSYVTFEEVEPILDMWGIEFELAE